MRFQGMGQQIPRQFERVNSASCNTVGVIIVQNNLTHTLFKYKPINISL